MLLTEIDKAKLYADAFNDGYEKARADMLDEVIKTLAKSEDTMLSDKQYYTLLELKEQKNET